MIALIDRLRQRRAAALAAVNLRLLLGFAFVPAGLKKMLGEPFTDPANQGAFHEFLHALHATGGFYRFVGAVQLVAAVLLMTQRFALVGALVALPVFSAIVAFCWSTDAGAPTRIATSLMLAGTLGLLAWDVRRLSALVRRPAFRAADSPVAADEGLWGRCGAAILVYYAGICAIAGGVYRPRGAAFDEPTFYSLPLLLAFPLVAYALERRRRRRAR